MKCPFCEVDINSAAIVCRHCGMKLRKSAAAAAILNFFFWGAGYWYCGKQWGVAILIAYIVLTIVGIQIIAAKGEPPEFHLQQLLIPWIISIALAYHAYKMAQTYSPNSKGGLDGHIRRLEEEIGRTADPGIQNQLQELLDKRKREREEKKQLVLNWSRAFILAALVALIIYGVLGFIYICGVLIRSHLLH